MGVPLIFAFGFGSPLLLWGLGLAGVPIAIHLLSRRKYRELPWAAMRFLSAAIRKHSRRMHLEQWLLLSVRTLIVVLIALAFARPNLESTSAVLGAAAPTHRILLLDSSMSMAYESIDVPLFEKAKGIAQKIVDESSQGDAFNLLRISTLDPTVLIRQPSFEKGLVQAEIEQLGVTHETGNVLQSLESTVALLKILPEIQQKDVYILSDFQRTNWESREQIREQLRQIAEGARLYLIDVGDPSSQNIAISDLRPFSPVLQSKDDIQFRGTISTFGPQPPAEIVAELWVDEKFQQSQSVALEPGTTTNFVFPYQFSAGGEHRIEIRVPDDSLPRDNRSFYSAIVRDQIRVLCVNGKLAGRSRDTATYLLELALAPLARKRQFEGVIRPQVIRAGEFRGIDLSLYDCIFLCNIGSFEPAEVELLGSYLQSGGGVVVSLGDQVQKENYNRLLYKDGQGILPAKILDRVGDPQNLEQGFEFDPLEYAHPIVNVFLGNPDTGLKTAQVNAYFKTELPAHGRSRVALEFSSGDPALVEFQVGAGRMILITTPVDDSWGNWALWPSFLPLMQETVWFAVEGKSGKRQTQVGDSIVRTVQARGSDLEVQVERPDKKRDPASSSTTGALAEITYDRTDLAGFYGLELGPPASRTEIFAINPSLAESDLAKISREELETNWLNGLEYEYQLDWAGSEKTDYLVPNRASATFARPLLLLALYLLFCEQLMAWKFQSGLCLLFPPYGLYHLWRTRMRGT